MGSKVSYEIYLMWTDNTPVKNTHQTYCEEVLARFILQKTLDKLKEMPYTTQKKAMELLTREVKEASYSAKVE